MYVTYVQLYDTHVHCVITATWKFLVSGFIYNVYSQAVVCIKGKYQIRWLCEFTLGSQTRARMLNVVLPSLFISFPMALTIHKFWIIGSNLKRLRPTKPIQIPSNAGNQTTTLRRHRPQSSSWSTYTLCVISTGTCQ